ncbi:MAG: AAA family ATPase [Bacteroidales bacterium]|jgi:5-methylcytosine-specific restriction protein B
MELKSNIDSFINETHYQEIINSQEFYFERLRELFNEYKSYNIDSFKNKLEAFIANPPEKFRFQDILDQNLGTAYFKFLELIGKSISVFDSKGYNINEWNPYPDKRTISSAIFTQKDWIYCLFMYKLNNFTFPGSEEKQYITFQHAVSFIENPDQNVNITSQNHRKQIVDFFNLQNESEINTLFQEYTSVVKNEINKGVLVASILYSPLIKKLWLDSVIGLMASDSTGWQEDYIRSLEGHDTCILWNSKRPSGTKQTLKFLRNIVAEGNSFNLYFCSGGYVRYKAVIIDFAENQQEQDKKAWSKKHEDIFNFQSNFNDYKDENKSAYIVFLASLFKRIEQIPVSDFEFYNGYQAPRQDNLSPIKAEPENVEINVTPISENKGDYKMDDKKIPLNQILFGPPGTGKTYNTINKALEIIARDFYLKNKKNRNVLTQKFRELTYDPKTEKGQIAFVTFHQSMCYEDFIEGIKPLDPEENDGQVVYDVIPGIFKKIVKSASTTGSNFQEKIEWLKKKCSEAENQQPLIIKTKGSEFSISYRGGRTFKIRPKLSLNPQSDYPASFENIRRVYDGASRKDVYNPTYVVGILDYLYANGLNRGKSINASNETPYVLIIDEINRGNVSQIFGELITLIEEDKRLGKDEALEVILPYSKEKFGVPPNLYIIGTMNTADRSIEALDTALRRRFSFETILPDSGLIEDNGNLKSELGIDLALLMDTINKRVEKLLDRDHQIGHSYFMSVKTLENLKEIFRHNIIPLLQEYFFGDYGKIGLVLGSKFFEDDGKQDQNTEKIFADFNDYDIDELEKRPVFKLIDPIKLTDEEFKAAIKELLL